MLFERLTAFIFLLRRMAPEVAMGESYDKSADVFSFGMVVYELITRDKPPMRKLKDCYAFNGDDHAGAFLLSSSSSSFFFFLLKRRCG